MIESTTKLAQEIVSGLAAELNRPLSAMIELSDRCNEVCVHCYQVQGQKGEMDTEQVFALLSELASAGVLLLTLSGGEVLLRKDFFEIAERARELGFALRIFTNGLLVDAEVARRFAALSVQTVEISVYSPVAETHDFVTGVAGSFDKTIAGIRALRSHDVPVVMKSPLMSVNAHQVDAYQQLANELGARMNLTPGDLTAREGGTVEPSQFNADEDGVRALTARFVHETRVPAGSRDPDSRSCGAGQGVHVEPDGQIRPCTMLDLDLGHVSEGLGRGAENPNPALSGLLSLRFRDLHGCRECDLAPYCGRCYAQALVETGDALGPHPSACKSARARAEAALGRAITLVSTDSGAASGPYRRESADRYRTIPDRVTSEDDKLAQRLGWTRKPIGQVSTAGLSARPGELVQLRRPGKRPEVQRVPLGSVDDKVMGRQGNSVGRSGGNE